MRDLIYALVILILLIMIAVLGILNIMAEGNDGFTELYFLDQSADRFSFGIHNLENRNMVYDYTAYVGSEQIAAGSLRLDHNEDAVISHGFVTNNTAKVSVALLNKDLEIHYWVNR